MNTCGNRTKLPSLYASWKSHALLGRFSELFGQASYPLQCNRCRNFCCWAQCQHFPVIAEYAWMYCWMYRVKTHSKFLMHEVVPLQVERWMEDRFLYSKRMNRCTRNPPSVWFRSVWLVSRVQEFFSKGNPLFGGLIFPAQSTRAKKRFQWKTLLHIGPGL